MFNVIPVDTLDTISHVIRTDSVSTADTVALTPIDSTEINPIIMGGIVVPIEEAVEVAPEIITGDVAVEPVMVGQVVLPPPPPPMIMGKMVCTKPKQENKPPKQKPVERKIKGEVIMLGE